MSTYIHTQDVYIYIYTHTYVCVYIFKNTNSILCTWFLCRQKNTVHRDIAPGPLLLEQAEVVWRWAASRFVPSTANAPCVLNIPAALLAGAGTLPTAVSVLRWADAWPVARACAGQAMAPWAVPAAQAPGWWSSRLPAAGTQTRLSRSLHARAVPRSVQADQHRPANASHQVYLSLPEGLYKREV